MRQHLALVTAAPAESSNASAESFAQPGNSFYFYRGRTALYALLRALDLKAGDEVIVQAYTCLAAILPILASGATPVYADVVPQTYTLDPAAVAARITERTRALIIQHTFGIPADLASLLELARAHGLTVIEDCCHVHGSAYDGRPLGSFGVAAFYSFHWSKPLAVGRGGLAVVNSPQLARRVASLHASFSAPSAIEVATLSAQYLAFKILRSTPFITHLRRLLRHWSPQGVASGQFKRAELDCQITADYTKKMAAATERRVRSMLAHGQNAIERRRNIGQKLHDHVVQLRLSPLHISPRSSVVFSQYPLHSKQRERVIRESQSLGVAMTPGFFSPIDPLTSSADWARVGYRAGTCPIAEELSQKTVTLPIQDWARDKDVHAMLDLIQAMKLKGLLESGPSR